MDNDAKKTHGGRLFLATWANRYPLVFILALGRFLFYVCRFQWTEACLSTASSFYSACGYAVRETKGIKRLLLILVGGGGALVFTLLTFWGKFFYTIFSPRKVWSYFSPTELDVLGSIFTQAKCYGFAHQCFMSIRERSLVTDATVALSCKWYAKNPRIRPEDVERLKKKVVALINAHPEWDETILSRLWDFIGEEKKVIESRRAIAQMIAKGTL